MQAFRLHHLLFSINGPRVKDRQTAERALAAAQREIDGSRRNREAEEVVHRLRDEAASDGRGAHRHTIAEPADRDYYSGDQAGRVNPRRGSAR